MCVLYERCGGTNNKLSVADTNNKYISLSPLVANKSIDVSSPYFECLLSAPLCVCRTRHYQVLALIYEPCTISLTYQI